MSRDTSRATVHGPAQVLVVDDEPSTAEFLANLLRAEGYEVAVAHGVPQASKLLLERPFSVVVSDLRLGADEGTALLPVVKQAANPPAILFVTGFGDVDSAVNALHDGAFDYISKPINLGEIEADLKSVVARAIKHHDQADGEGDTVPVPQDNDTRTMVGGSTPMVKVYRAVAKAAMSRETVLISGESGTGKELVAHAIHEKSQWADKPFVAVNCCALTETLLESELFGHVRGSFTGATQNKRGLFEEATGGTLFLDEVGDVSLALQVKLLRAIQEGEIKPVGSNDTRKVDVRIVAATHRDLVKAVQEGRFREDLYYRLKVILIEMPALRERQRDIPDLIHHFMARYSKRTGKHLTAISDEAMALLLNYSWPGNIRELENAISRAASMASSNVLYPEDFPDEVANRPVAKASHDGAASGDMPTASSNFVMPGLQTPETQQSLEQLERLHIAKVLQSVNYNKSKAADILGIDRVTLYRKVFKYGIFAKVNSHNSEN